MSYHNPTILAELNKVIQRQQNSLAFQDRLLFKLKAFVGDETFNELKNDVDKEMQLKYVN
jgi:hypothetical protein